MFWLQGHRPVPTSFLPCAAAVVLGAVFGRLLWAPLTVALGAFFGLPLWEVVRQRGREHRPSLPLAGGGPPKAGPGAQPLPDPPPQQGQRREAAFPPPSAAAVGGWPFAAAPPPVPLRIQPPLGKEFTQTARLGDTVGALP